MNKRLRWLLVTGLLGLLGCSADNDRVASLDMLPESASSVMKMAQPQHHSDTNYLAYEHTITVEMASDKVAVAYQKLADLCTGKTFNNCTLMTSNLQSGEYSAAQLRMRLAPSDVQTVLASAKNLGQVTFQNTQVDDLQSAVVDNAKRIEMLVNYRDKLQALEQTSAQDVESLIRIASELSRVQSDLEFVQGEKARLVQRIDLQIVNVHLKTQIYANFWSPIGIALANFGENFSTGLSETLTVIAYGLPGFGVFLLVLGLLRRYWRKFR